MQAAPQVVYMFRTSLIVAAVFYAVVLAAAVLWLCKPGPEPRREPELPPVRTAPPPPAPAAGSGQALQPGVVAAAAAARRGLLRMLSLGTGEGALSCPITCVRMQDPVRAEHLSRSRLARARRMIPSLSHSRCFVYIQRVQCWELFSLGSDFQTRQHSAH